jgi:DNA polymerase III gamma/tau subunit
LIKNSSKQKAGALLNSLYVIFAEMLYKNIIGQDLAKQRLISSVKENRVSHAQLFLGPSGSGALALALAYIQYIGCENISRKI